MITILESLEVAKPECCTEKVYLRNELILQTGQIERFVYSIQEGALRVVLNKKDGEQNIRFGYPGSILTSIPSFYDNSPSLFDIRALRKTKLKCYNKRGLFEYIDTSDEFKSAYLESMHSLIRHLIEREIDLLTYSPQERYEIVLSRSPQVFQHIPAQHIANYLRMSPEHLSRLRNS